jgi:hypothetical protein
MLGWGQLLYPMPRRLLTHAEAVLRVHTVHGMLEI